MVVGPDRWLRALDATVPLAFAGDRGSFKRRRDVPCDDPDTHGPRGTGGRAVTRLIRPGFPAMLGRIRRDRPVAPMVPYRPNDPRRDHVHVPALHELVRDLG